MLHDLDILRNITHQHNIDCLVLLTEQAQEVALMVQGTGQPEVGWQHSHGHILASLAVFSVASILPATLLAFLRISTRQPRNMASCLPHLDLSDGDKLWSRET